jgi:hypothetical protein
MIRLFRRVPAVPAGRRGRVWLRLEDLEGRATPAGDPVPISGSEPIRQDVQAAANQAPQIVNFSASEIGNGWYMITGQVIDERPGGLTIHFGGSVETMSGQTTMTDSNGAFSVLVHLNNDGSDTGWLLATTTDDLGASSNEASQYVDPSGS